MQTIREGRRCEHGTGVIRAMVEEARRHCRPRCIIPRASTLPGVGRSIEENR
ncbi:hypothetical protein [Microbulbifer sp. 2205BS26-8]|uniref:hypothetical protein n=1 Tax=Microbulbifer sp. 2205BS26-8 TaxID=3064386 RepID=UPI00273E7CAB|nr:hypothetical protein [Microbulbifer sp. 2205BS26-8]MDP5208536.1 hypothetical protein [Microbulbifer sp. 2205BS26-8]